VFAALLDTSVLWPSLQRDFLLSLAIEGLYRPLWSSAILDELQFHEARKLVERGSEPDEAARQSQRLIDQMSTAFDDSSVENWEPLIGLADFRTPLTNTWSPPRSSAERRSSLPATSKTSLRNASPVISPAQFAADTVAVSPAVARHAVTTMLSRFIIPPLTVEQFVEQLVTRYNMTEAAELIRGTI